MSYRVVYGRTMPDQRRVFKTKREADAFARERKGLGDVIFKVRKTEPGESAQSVAKMLTNMGYGQ